MHFAEQLDLPLHHAPACVDDVAAFLLLLSGRGWLKAAEICDLADGLTPRKIRKLAEHAEGRIISCPAKGYKLTREATADEFLHACNDLRSRTRKMLDRYRQTNNAWHAAPHTK